MNWKREIKILVWMTLVFTAAFYLPLQNDRFREAIMAMFDLTKWYAQEHVILCLIPAFFIAGVISVFVSQGAVMKYFGAKAKKWVAYTVASVS
ncbi:MAG: permease, partial [Bacteroidales bacterium]|nr:permease [Bacteroidales bacterium]